MSRFPLIMTVDVEDWFTSSVDLFSEAAHNGGHERKPDESVLKNTLRCLELFARHGSKATFFILTTVAEVYPDLIREMLRQGHEVGIHAYRHRLVYNLTPAEFEEDLERSMDILKGVGVNQIYGFRAPYWSITKKSLWALDILKRRGLKYDASIFPIYRELYGIPDAPTVPHEIRPGFWEYPPATVRCFGINLPVAGGGYLRMLPFGLLKQMIRFNRAQGPMVFYLHPYELDPEDASMPIKLNSLKSRLYYWQQMVGRRSNPAKIERLLQMGRFQSIAGAFGWPDQSQLS
jgi:polysaccharide deacetylase family protein (PEP-CTERM system associated)